ncbi:hypothetical protein FBALC1_13027 [Flavobacteriales bacterium ALC-1]|nr:hypothetical protein FBALC1_13027 [Flavobacteriales bacterium ALC-1]
MQFGFHSANIKNKDCKGAVFIDYLLGKLIDV